MSRTSRREFLKAGLFGAGTISLTLLAASRLRGASGKVPPMREALGPLRPVADETTGLKLLDLPEGFRYKTFSWAGTELGDGFPVPGKADGMGVVAQHESRVTLVRNHELVGSSGAIGDPASAYDVTGGGTTTLVFDTEAEAIVDSWISLGGTANNCAGGVTPWGTWLSCEEVPFSPRLRALPIPARQAPWHIEGARREHGFVFEVPSVGVARPEPLLAMGQFYHEAVAIDPDSGIAYLTEDTAPAAGFYRFLPERPGDLAAGGQLQMMKVRQRPDMRNGLPLGQRFDVSWVDIPDPTAGFVDGERDGNGVVTQGLAAGGSAFTSLEGCAFDAGRVYFTSKYGGRVRAGYIYEYRPTEEQIQVVFDSPGHAYFSGPDNLVVSPRGGLVVCEDRVVAEKKAQHVAALTAEGEFVAFCRTHPGLRGHHAGFDLSKTVLMSEWSGATFSKDGQWLFVNIYNPGVTLAITGPWREGII